MGRHDTRAFKPLSAEDELRAAAAGVGARQSHGLPPSNWGKSFTSPNVNTENQLVRVTLPQSRDLTLYLQPARDASNGLPEVSIVDYKVSIGTGGVAVVQTFIPCPVFGVVRHFTADVIEVSVLTPSASPGHPTLVAANVALGRPSDVIEAGSQVGLKGVASPTPAQMASFLTIRPTAHGWITVSPGTAFQPLIRVPQFATHMQVEIYNPLAVADADMQLWGITPTGGESVVHQLVSAYAQPLPLPPQFALFNFRNNDAANSYQILVNFLINF